MAKFNAATALEAVEFDFTKYGGPEGEIPEPSQQQVETFFDQIAGMKRLLNKVEADVKNAADQEELDQVIANLPEDEIDKVKNELATYVADLCSQFPTTEDVRKLPYRVFVAFMMFLIQEYGPKDDENASPNLRVARG